ncbi:hypothetical protein [Parvularcula sp. LCG005]|uniref:hypothetical protein n=1 Tax=Parvularcula sp. LCG005 TaxID=3078805 RepID=UPI0029436BCA|nr:hypothetical protein [Parvularcula sp. LCG005]WOI53515.1 hypothetical protein RUI03_00640 [Parvularcula sp. LCG005]
MRRFALPITMVCLTLSVLVMHSLLPRSEGPTLIIYPAGTPLNAMLTHAVTSDAAFLGRGPVANSILVWRDHVSRDQQYRPPGAVMALNATPSLCARRTARPTPPLTSADSKFVRDPRIGDPL